MVPTNVIQVSAESGENIHQAIASAGRLPASRKLLSAVVEEGRRQSREVPVRQVEPNVGTDRG
jgi:hypothetical protein